MPTALVLLLVSWMQTSQPLGILPCHFRPCLPKRSSTFAFPCCWLIVVLGGGRCRHYQKPLCHCCRLCLRICLRVRLRFCFSLCRRLSFSSAPASCCVASCQPAAPRPPPTFASPINGWLFHNYKDGSNLFCCPYLALPPSNPFVRHAGHIVWMQGLAAREGDVDKDKAVFSNCRRCAKRRAPMWPLLDGYVIVLSSF